MMNDMRDGGSPAWSGGLESLLGPDEDRYFASGYRSVNYALDFSAVARNAGEVRAGARVRYPERWSAAGSGPARAAHLSSVDAVILPLLALEEVASDVERRRLGRFRVVSINLRAGSSPWLALDSVPVEFTAGEDAGAIQLSGHTGNIRFEILAATQGVSSERSPVSSGHPSVYGGLFQCTQTLSTVTALDPASGELIASHTIAHPDGDTAGPGFEAELWASPTVIDYLVTMGQLTQALVYASAGTTRAEAGPLWMRTMRIHIREPQPHLPIRFGTTTRLLRDRLLTRGGGTLHDVTVESVSTSGVHARSTLAYKEVSA